jgi:hypothetical protein
MTWLDSGFIAIGPRFAQTYRRCPGMTSEDNEKPRRNSPELFDFVSVIAGLGRQSICFERLLRRSMDARVKPAHDAACYY